MVRLLQELVRADSVNRPPAGTEMQAQSVLREFFRTWNIRPEMYSLDILGTSGHRCVRGDRNYKGRKNLTVRFDGVGRGRSLLLNGHVDTVPPGTHGWSDSPWSGRLRGGRVYGLGSFDMKAGLVAQAAVMAALQRAGSQLGGDLIFESVVDEEWGGGGGTLAGRLRGDNADAAVVSEGTQLQILRASRGGFVVDLHVSAGDASAYFSRGEVVSPGVPLGRLLGWVDSWAARRRMLRTDGAYVGMDDPAPVQVLAVEANRMDRDVPLSVPTTGAVRVYFQFLPEEDADAVIGEIRRSLLEFQRCDPFFRQYAIEWKPLYDPPLLGHELAEAHPWTECMRSSAQHVQGIAPVISVAPYPCDAFLLQREFGIPVLLFGPRGGGAHNPDEYVEVTSVITTAEVLLTAALQWCNG
jgi:acetylornithine deacetylase